VFGYGGNFAVGAELLRAGASHIVLLDRFAPPDARRNRELVRAYPDYFILQNGRVETVDAFLTLIHDDVKNVRVNEKFDVVLSTSVYEHLDDVDGLTAALASLTKPDGIHVHYVDLRDHYFKLPFEMLKFSERIWKTWLNPTSNLNRFRLRDYQRVFEKYFSDVMIHVLEREPEAFARARNQIRPEFLTGDEAHDTVTLIEAVASRPR
jgi:SAM-dependent methyltransferase